MSDVPYDSDNVFAKILRGDLPSRKAYEDDDVLVIMDLMPRVDGHALVLPKRPSRNLLDIESDSLVALIGAVRRVARASVRAFDADGVTVQQFNESAGGQVIFHTHVHVLPRREGVSMKPPGSETADAEVLDAHARKLGEAIAATSD